MPTFNYKEHTIHYYEYGKGEQLLIALHGFADSGLLFGHLEEALSEKYTVVALDLPFHGNTQWNADIYRPEEVADWMEIIRKKYGKTNFSLMCHSMGGRLLLGALPMVIKEVKELYFLATAGVAYTFSASKIWWPLWARRWVRKRMIDSNFFIRIFDYLHDWKLLNTATYQLFKMQLDLPRRRARLLRSWEALYYFPMLFNQQSIRLIEEAKVSTYFFFGKEDKVTTPKNGKKVASKIKQAQWIETPGNHFFIKNKLALYLRKWLEESHTLEDV